MGVWGSIKNAAKAAYNSDAGWVLPGGALYKGSQLLKPDTTGQKAAADKAGADIGRVGEKITGGLDAGGAAAAGAFKPADAAINSSNANAPTQLTDLYQNHPAAPTNTQDVNYDIQGMGPGPATGLYNKGSSGPGLTTTNLQSRDPNAPVSGMNTRITQLGIKEAGPTSTESMLPGVQEYMGAPSTIGRRYGEIGSISTEDPIKTRLSELSRGGTSSKIGSFLAGGIPQTGVRGDILSNKIGDQRSALEGQEFDPTKTMAVGDAYNRFSKDSGPSASEGFYQSVLAGNNPAAERDKSMLMKDLQRSSAARGGFNSSAAMQQEREGLTSLAAKNFANLGTLAGQSDTQKQARYGTLGQLANQYDTSVLGNRKLNADIAAARDAFTGRKGETLAGLAKSGDTLAMEGRQYLGNLAAKDDDLTGAREGRVNDLTVQLSGAIGAKEARGDVRAIGTDTVAGNKIETGIKAGSAADVSRAGIANPLTSLISDTGALNQRGIEATDDAAYKADLIQEAKDNLEYLKASGASKEQIDQAEVKLKAATSADDVTLRQNHEINDLAARASGEQAGRNKDAVDAALRAAIAKTGVQSIYDMAKSDVTFKTGMAQVEIELQKAGLDPAATQSLINNILSLSSLGVKALGGK